MSKDEYLFNVGTSHEEWYTEFHLKFPNGSMGGSFTSCDESPVAELGVELMKVLVEHESVYEVKPSDVPVRIVNGINGERKLSPAQFHRLQHLVESANRLTKSLGGKTLDLKFETGDDQK